MDGTRISDVGIRISDLNDENPRKTRKKEAQILESPDRVNSGTAAQEFEVRNAGKQETTEDSVNATRKTPALLPSCIPKLNSWEPWQRMHVLLGGQECPVPNIPVHLVLPFETLARFG
ncbi:MAG: hypothetical protein HY290_09165 [Planctomycetia bacterium]|nr:hypothetical protein [Planctomycetia bacterium]